LNDWKTEERSKLNGYRVTASRNRVSHDRIRFIEWRAVKDHPMHFPSQILWQMVKSVALQTV